MKPWLMPAALAAPGCRLFRRRLVARRGAAREARAGGAGLARRRRASPTWWAPRSRTARRANGSPTSTSRRADGSGAFALTSGDKSSTGPAWSPDGKWIAFLSGRGPKDKDGKDPKANVWRIRVDGGEAEALTDEKGGVTRVRWSPDGKTHRVPDDRPEDRRGGEGGQGEARRARRGRGARSCTRLYVVPVEKDAEGKRPVRRLTEGTMSLGNLAGPVRVRLVARRPPHRLLAPAHAAHQRLAAGRRLDRRRRVGAACARWPRRGAAESDPVFSPDGKQVAFDQSNDPPTWRRRSRVAIVPVEGGTPRLLAETPDAQPDLVGWTEGRPHRVRRDAPHGQPRRRAAGGRRRADVREPGRRHGRRTRR